MNGELHKNKDEEILETAIEEQRRVFGFMWENYQHIKVRTVAFFGASFAILTFLYASGGTFYPKQLYGRIFYFIALGLILAGLSLLCIALQATKWEWPTEKSRLLKLDFHTRLDYLSYIRDRYILCYDLNVAVCEKKHSLLRMSFYPLLIGAIILILLKLFKEAML